jgi:hypothetical protein
MRQTCLNFAFRFNVNVETTLRWYSTKSPFLSSVGPQMDVCIEGRSASCRQDTIRPIKPNPNSSLTCRATITWLLLSSRRVHTQCPTLCWSVHWDKHARPKSISQGHVYMGSQTGRWSGCIPYIGVPNILGTRILGTLILGSPTSGTPLLGWRPQYCISI